MISANNIFILNANERERLILEEAGDLSHLDSEIEKTREISNVLNTFLSDYFPLRLEEDNNRAEGSVLIENNLIAAFDLEIQNFKPRAISVIQNAFSTPEDLRCSSKNIYEMSGAAKLSIGNKVTRNLSTTMGLLWERFASISPYAINPEAEFNMKIKGIDLIASNIDTMDIEYQQLKTQRNTLTGSQQGRSAEELNIHDYPVFCACFTNSPWTFNHPDIPRVSGEEFWSRIGIPYNIVKNKATELILSLEEEYIELLR